MRDWLSCSYRHLLKHVHKIDLETRGDATIIGTAFHSCVELRVQGAEPIRRVLVELIEEEKKEITLDDVRNAFDVEACADQAIEMSARAMTFLDETFPGWRAISVEEDLYEPIEGRNEKFKGFVDLVLEVEGKRGKKITWILDWKTSSRPWDRKKLTDPKTFYQLALYKAYWCAKHRADAKDVRCGFLVALKSGKPEKTFRLHAVSVGPVIEKRVLTVLNNFVGSVSRGRALKNKSEQNCRYCEYRGTPSCP